jgi:trehalose/maltose hydrolase-like predicted phosphorylase
MTLRERTWEISEAPFIPNKLHHAETIYSIGNGYMGLRASFEEGYPDELVSTLVHGIFDHASGELVPELVNLPNPLPVTVFVDGEPFHLTQGKHFGYRRSLNLEKAILQRGVIWQNSQGTIVQITFERFASLELEHLLAQRITVRALNRACTITISASIDGTQTNEGVQHWGTIQAGCLDHSIYVTGRTAQSGYEVAIVSALLSDHGGATGGEPTAEDLQPKQQLVTSLEREQAVTFYKFSAIHSSRDFADPTDAATQTVESAIRRGWQALFAEHAARWADYWHDCDVEITGDELAQRAIRFAIYHVLIATPQHDEHVSIGAKTLSGPGYKGHVFWDTELFMLPFLTVTQPKLARNLLMYRYHNLQGARNKAKEAGFEGAMFPWESTDTGEETTPRWTNPAPDGSRIRIWTGDTEQHISTDIAYAVMQYWQWTADEEFFVKHGAEIVLDTAVFWGTRAEYNAELDRFELRMQIGPDEYHENIDNSVFTNSMVRWHLKTALDVRQWLLDQHPQEAAALLARLAITDERLAHWQQIIDKMVIFYDPDQGILEQFEGFFKLDRVDLSLWTPRTAAMDYILGHETIQHTMIIKQADVVMLMALLGDQVGDDAFKRRNWNFYYPIVDHGSSLSPSTHAWIAARIGLINEAYKEFLFAARIDLEDSKGNVRDGIHAAAAGGLWEAAIFGFAGVNPTGAEFSVNPNLPEDWQGMTFRVYRHGTQHVVRLTRE